MSAEKPLVTEVREGPVALLALDHPPLNLLTLAMRRQLDACLRRLEEDPAVRAVVITGAGERAFSAGSDVRELPTRRGEGRNRARLEHEVFGRLEALPQPTIAAIIGPALGGGLELALACDFRVADEGATLGLPETHIGLFAAGGGTQRLPRLVGEARAKELLYLGRSLTARNALEIGLVNRVVPAGKAREASLELARELAQRPALALRAIKDAVHFGRHRALEEGLAREAELIDRIYVSHDAQEGIKAFLEKRKPGFRHK